MQAEVIRLKNAPKGQPYAIERISDLTPDDAAAQATVWWDSKGTLAVVVTVDGKEDARYEREYMDTTRVPKAWEAAKPQKPVAPIPQSPIPQAPPKRPVAPPTLVNTKPTQKDPRVQCHGCGRNVRASTILGHREKSDPTDAACCAVCGVGYTCETCGRELPKDRKYAGDDDRTPSGRLENRRCPRCGAPLTGMSRRQIHRLYTGT